MSSSRSSATADTPYVLRTEDILYLQQNNVREPVIRFMQDMGNRAIYAPVQPVYVVQPPPPVGIGVGFRFR